MSQCAHLANSFICADLTRGANARESLAGALLHLYLRRFDGTVKKQRFFGALQGLELHYSPSHAASSDTFLKYSGQFCRMKVSISGIS